MLTDFTASLLTSKMYLFVVAVALMGQVFSYHLRTGGVEITNQDKGGRLGVRNTKTMEQFELSVVGIYEKSQQNVVIKSFDVGTYTFEQSIPYNVSNKDVELAEMNYFTDLTKDTKLVIGANIVKTHGYLPLTSDINFDEMFKVYPDDVLIYFMIRDWCKPQACSQQTNSTIELRLSINTPNKVKDFAEVKSDKATNSTRAVFCNESNSSCNTKFQMFQYHTWKLAFSNYVNLDGGYQFNKSPVLFSSKAGAVAEPSKKRYVSLEMKLSGSEILYGPIHVSWQKFYVNNGRPNARQSTILALLVGVLTLIIHTPG